MALISIDNASIGYEGKTVLSEISLKIREKDYICIVGENGSGKTTLMKCMLGLIQPLSGKITYGEGLKQNEIGYLPQQTVFQKDFPACVSEVVMSGCLNKKHTLFYSKEQKEKAEKNMLYAKKMLQRAVRRSAAARNACPCALRHKQAFDP